VNSQPRFFSPAETARRFKVSTKALRLYEELGLVTPIRSSTGWRTYGPDQMSSLHQVLALKSLGLPLKRIRELLADQLSDLDAVLRLQEAAFRARIAGDRRRLEVLAAVRRRLADCEPLSADDLIQLTGETVMGITKTHDAFVHQDEAMAVIRAAGLYPLLMDVPPETSGKHWHDFDSVIFVLEGENVIVLDDTGETIVCGPGTRTDFPRGIMHHEDHTGFRALYGLSIDPAAIQGPINMPPESWAG
jgi:DNA-binding transcriptional MerR regulator